MSNTSTNPRLREWFPRLLSGRPHQIIGGADDPYMLRWYVIPRNPMLNVYLHKFTRSDDDRALHDHPWWFVSLILRGQYDEITAAGTKRRRAGTIAYRPAEWRHRVALLPTRSQQARYDHVANQQRMGITSGKAPLLLPGLLRPEEKPTWTVIVTGRRVRTWGFWCPRWASWVDRDPAGTIRHERNDRFIPWDEFGDAGCGEPS